MAARLLLTNLSKGELSPLIEGRPDLAAYFEGGSKIENFVILRQGGITRRIGSRFIYEVKFSAKDTILLPFEVSAETAYVMELGDAYSRFHRNKARVLNGAATVELLSPYVEAQLRKIHYTQSVDILFTFHVEVQQQKWSRTSDIAWVVQPITSLPPPSFEDDANIAGAATLTPAATSGNGITITASAAVFLAADVGRQIVAGAARAIIKTVDAGLAFVTADIIDTFPNLAPIPAGSWFLRLSPQTTLDPDKKEPIGTEVTLVAAANAFRAADLGKFIKIYDGLVKITIVDSALQVRGELLSEMAGTDLANPAAAPAGAWSLEVSSWSATTGFPRTGELYAGRMAVASTNSQKTTFWLSSPDDFDKYAVGIEANKAIEYTIASKALNQINWIADNQSMFLGTSGGEHQVDSGKDGEAIGGDKIPREQNIGSYGSAEIQPIVRGKKVIYVDRSRLQIFGIGFDIEKDGYDPVELTGAAEHITGTGIRLGPLAFAKRPNSQIYFVREDGQLVVLTYYPNEKVIGFTRLVTDGAYEAVAAIPQAAGKPDSVYVIVKRTIGGVDKRYVEVFDEECSELAGREWKSLQTDCSVVGNVGGISTTIITGLGHLEGKTVDIVTDGVYRDTKVVAGGQVTVAAFTQHYEVGLHYDSEVITMRPAINGQMVEGLTRTWSKVCARFYKTIGGLLNGKVGKPVLRKGEIINPLAQPALRSGDVMASTDGVDTDGKLTVKQDKPYPMTILAIFGEIEFGDHM